MRKKGTNNILNKGFYGLYALANMMAHHTRPKSTRIEKKWKSGKCFYNTELTER
jgi:hypothetical protein